MSEYAVREDFTSTRRLYLNEKMDRKQ